MRSRLRAVIALLTLHCFLLTSVFGQALAATAVPGAPAPQLPAPAASTPIVPAAAGRITSAHDFGSDAVVVNIQNLHCHPEVQRNIARLLASLDGQFGLAAVYIEGAAGVVDTSWLSEGKDAGLDRKAVEGLMDRGRLTGAEYYAVTAGRPRLLYGIEDQGLYEANLQRLNRILEAKPTARLALAPVKKTVEELRGEWCGAPVRRFEKLLAAHRAGKLDGVKYYRALAGYGRDAGVDITACKNLDAYLRLLETGRSLKYARVQKELQRFVAHLKERIPYGAYRALQRETGGFSRPDELYPALARTAREYRIDLSAWPHLSVFFSYLERSRAINPLALVREERLFQSRVKTALAATPAERDILFLADFLPYLEDYCCGTISYDDYRYYRDNLTEFRLVLSKYAGPGMFATLASRFALLDEYYAANVERNDRFLDCIASREGNLDGGPAAQAVKADPAFLKKAGKVIVVVTGGFHTEGLARLLNERRISNVVITPGITQDTALSDEVYDRLVREQAAVSSQALEVGVLTGFPVVDRMAEKAGSGAAALFADSGRAPGEIEELVNGTLQDCRFSLVSKPADGRFVYRLQFNSGKAYECTYHAAKGLESAVLVEEPAEEVSPRDGLPSFNYNDLNNQLEEICGDMVGEGLIEGPAGVVYWGSINVLAGKDGWVDPALLGDIDTILEVRNTKGLREIRDEFLRRVWEKVTVRSRDASGAVQKKKLSELFPGRNYIDLKVENDARAKVLEIMRDKMRDLDGSKSPKQKLKWVLEALSSLGYYDEFNEWNGHFMKARTKQYFALWKGFENKNGALLAEIRRTILESSDDELLQRLQLRPVVQPLYTGEEAMTRAKDRPLGLVRPLAGFVTSKILPRWFLALAEEYLFGFFLGHEASTALGGMVGAWLGLGHGFGTVLMFAAANLLYGVAHSRLYYADGDGLRDGGKASALQRLLLFPLLGASFRLAYFLPFADPRLALLISSVMHIAWNSGVAPLKGLPQGMSTSIWDYIAGRNRKKLDLGPVVDALDGMLLTSADRRETYLVKAARLSYEKTAVTVHLLRLSDGVLSDNTVLRLDSHSPLAPHGLSFSIYFDDVKFAGRQEDLTHNRFGAQLFRAMAPAIPEGTPMGIVVLNWDTRKTLYERLYIDAAGRVRQLRGTARSDGDPVVVDAAAEPGQVSCDDVLAGTLMGRLCANAGFHKLSLEIKDIPSNNTFKGHEALKFLIANADGNSKRVPSFTLKGMKTAPAVTAQAVPDAGAQSSAAAVPAAVTLTMEGLLEALEGREVTGNDGTVYCLTARQGKEQRGGGLVYLQRAGDGAVSRQRVLNFSVPAYMAGGNLRINEFYLDEVAFGGEAPVNLAEKGLGGRIIALVGEQLPKGSFVYTTIANEPTKRQLRDEYAIDPKDGLLKRSADKAVVVDAVTGPGQVSVADALAATRIGRLNRRAGLAPYRLEVEAYDENRVLENTEALRWVIAHSGLGGRLLPDFVLVSRRQDLPPAPAKEQKPSSSFLVPLPAGSGLLKGRLLQLADALSEDVRVPDSAAAKTLAAHEKGAASKTTHADYALTLQRIAKEAGLSGRAVYAPFGGFDPFTPFTLVPSAKDVFVFGFEPFGGMRDIENFFSRNGPLDPAVCTYHHFDSERAYEALLEEYGIEGLGSLAVARIITALKGRVTAIHYFSVDDSGTPVFHDGSDDAGSAVIEFVDQQGEKKRYWYLQDDAYRSNPAFEKLLQRKDFDFQTLLIKAVPPVWDGSISSEERRNSLRKSLIPARGRAGVTVVNDVRRDIVGFIKQGVSHPIWQKDYVPEWVELGKNEDFGYSAGGGNVYYGDARHLVGEETPTGQVLNYMQDEGDGDFDEFSAGYRLVDKPRLQRTRNAAKPAGQQKKGNKGGKDRGWYGGSPDMAADDMTHEERNVHLLALIRDTRAWRFEGTRAELELYRPDRFSPLRGLRSLIASLRDRGRIERSVVPALRRLRSNGGTIDRLVLSRGAASRLHLDTFTAAINAQRRQAGEEPLSQEQVLVALGLIARSVPLLVVEGSFTLYPGGPLAHARRGLSDPAGPALWLGEKLLTAGQERLADEDVALLLLEEAKHLFAPLIDHTAIAHDGALRGRLFHCAAAFFGETPDFRRSPCDMAGNGDESTETGMEEGTIGTADEVSIFDAEEYLRRNNLQKYQIVRPLGEINESVRRGICNTEVGDNLYRQECSTRLAVDADNRIVGYIQVEHRDGGVEFVHYLMVDSRQHRNGIGTALLVSVLEEAKHAGRSAVQLHYKGSNEDLKRFYESFFARYPGGYIDPGQVAKDRGYVGLEYTLSSASRQVTITDTQKLAARLGRDGLFDRLWEVTRTVPRWDDEDIRADIAYYYFGASTACRVALNAAGEIVGYVLLEESDDVALHLAYVVIRKDYQRTGLGTRLFEAAAEYARKQGYSKLYLEYGLEDAGRVQFYENLKKKYPFHRINKEGNPSVRGTFTVGNPGQLSGPLFLEYHGITYGSLDPASGEIALDLNAARGALRDIAPGIDDNRLKGFIHAHELFHLLARGVAVDRGREDELANAFARRALGAGTADDERLLREFIATTAGEARRKLSAMDGIRYESPEFLLTLTRLGIDIYHLRSGDLNSADGAPQLEIALWHSGAEIEAIGRKYQGYSSRAGISPRGIWGNGVVLELALTGLLPSLEKNGVRRKSGLDGAEVLIIGPGDNASEIIRLLELFPGIKTVHVVDARCMFLDELKSRLREMPGCATKVRVYRTNVMELPAELKGRIDLAFENGVFDPAYFSPDQLRQAARQIGAALNDGGIHISSSLMRTYSLDHRAYAGVPGMTPVILNREQNENFCVYVKHAVAEPVEAPAAALQAVDARKAPGGAHAASLAQALLEKLGIRGRTVPADLRGRNVFLVRPSDAALPLQLAQQGMQSFVIEQADPGVASEAVPVTIEVPLPKPVRAALAPDAPECVPLSIWCEYRPAGEGTVRTVKYRYPAEIAAAANGDATALLQKLLEAQAFWGIADFLNTSGKWGLRPGSVSPEIVCGAPLLCNPALFADDAVPACTARRNAELFGATVWAVDPATLEDISLPEAWKETLREEYRPADGRAGAVISLDANRIGRAFADIVLDRGLAVAVNELAAALKVKQSDAVLKGQGIMVRLTAGTAEKERMGAIRDRGCGTVILPADEARKSFETARGLGMKIVPEITADLCTENVRYAARQFLKEGACAGVIVDLSGASGVEGQWIERLGREARGEGSLWVVLPANASLELHGVCRKAGVGLILKRSLADARLPGAGQEYVDCVEACLPDDEAGMGRTLSFERLRQVARGYQQATHLIVPDLLFENAAFADRAVDGTAAGFARGREQGYALDEKDIPEFGMPYIDALRALPDSGAIGNMDAAALDRFFAAASALYIRVGERYPAASQRCAALIRQGLNNGSLEHRRCQAAEFRGFAESLGVRMLLAENRRTAGGEGFVDEAAWRAFGEYLLKGLQVTATARTDTRGRLGIAGILVAAGLLPAAGEHLMALSGELQVLPRDASTELLLLQYGALVSACLNKASRGTVPRSEREELAKLALPLLEPLAERSAVHRASLLAQLAAIAGAAGDMAKADRYAALEEGAVKAGVPAVLPDDPLLLVLSIDAASRSQDPSKMAVAAIERLRSMDEADPQVLSAVLRIYDLYVERRLPQLLDEGKMKNAVFNVLAVATGIQTAG